MNSATLYRHIIPLALALAATAPADASVLDPVSRLYAASAAAGPQSRTETDYEPMIIRLTEDRGEDALKEQGVVIFHRRGDMVLACVPREIAGDIEHFPFIGRASLGRRASALLDKARKATNADLAESMPQWPYTGSGVTVGMADIGFDPGHVAFRGRIAAVSYYDEENAGRMHTADAAEIAALDSDAPAEHHATHVAGILAGGDMSVPYYGIARGARLVATTSALSDVGILAGVEDIIAEAKAAGQPAVVNLSLGSNIGPHDGTDLFCRYLDLCAAEAAILISAGNHGGDNMSAELAFTADETVRSVMLESTYWNDLNLLNGVVDLWADDATPVDVRVRVWDLYEKCDAYVSPWISLAGDNVAQHLIDSETDEDFGRLFYGKIACAGEVNPDNDRFNLTVMSGLNCIEAYPERSWPRHYIVLDYRSAPGVRADACIESAMKFRSGGEACPVVTGSPRLSINSMACGHNIICVGSSTTRDTAPLLSGGESSWAGFVNAGTVSGFSSYGTTFDGRDLPHFCAPGAYVVSAFSGPCLRNAPEQMSIMAAESKAAPGNYYYAECGTSMAAPHAAGIFALWLEAEPTLTPSELLEIAVSTVSEHGVDIADPRTGAGVIDAAAGLRLILDRAGIDDGDVSSELITVRRIDGRVVVGGVSDDARIEVFDMTGRRVGRDALPQSPVVVRVTDGRVSAVRKI